MDNKIVDRIIELRKNYNFGSPTIAKYLIQEFPQENLTLKGWQSRIDRALKKVGLNKRNIPDVNISNTQETISNNITKHSIERKTDGSYVYEGIIELLENEEVTPDRMMEAHHLNPREWEVVSYKNNFWSQQSKGGQTVLLYQSKLIVRPRRFDNISEELVLQHFLEASIEHKAPGIPNEYKKENSPMMLEVNICDLHLGKLAFDVTSNDMYNYKIARSRFFDLINKEYIRAKENNVEKILFVWSNDFFNTDGITDSTTRGTPQKSALPWQSLFLEGVSMLVDAIEILASVAPVKSFYISSNHSRQADFYALCYLQAWFRNTNNVQIINNQKSRYYEKYGTVLLGFSHSYYEKENNLYHLMSTECPEDWATTTYREFHLAHYHSEKVKDVGGVIYRWLPTVCGTDEYHYDKGYVGSVKRSYSFLYDKFVGLVQMNCDIVNI